jgi:heme-degrading monooxygenase HmoA
VVSEEFEDKFISAYESNGDWARLFRQCDGYIRTDLLRDSDNKRRFVTIDYWDSRSQYLSMKDVIQKEYSKLDSQFETYTEKETHIGYFELETNSKP